MSTDRAIVQIPLANIKMAENSRQEFNPNEMAELMTSMRQSGLLQPIGVQHLGGEKFQIVFGFRRYFAAKKLGWDKIDGVLTAINDEHDSLIKNSIENVQRANVSLAEQGRIFSILKKEGVSPIEIAARIGCSKQFVNTALASYTDVPKQFRERVSHGVPSKRTRNGNIPATTAFRINALRSKYKLTENQRDSLLGLVTKDPKFSGESLRLISTLMGDFGLSLKDSLAQLGEIQIVNLKFAMPVKKIKLLKRKYNLRPHEVAYSWLEQNRELGVISMRKDKNKVISHTAARRKPKEETEE